VYKKLYGWRNMESYNKSHESWYSARSRIKSLKIVFWLHKRSKFNLTSGVKTAPADHATQGGGARVGGPCADPPKNFSRHSCRLCFVVLMDAPQFTSNCSIAGRWRGIMTMFSQPLQGGGRICSYATGIASRVKP